MTLIFVYKNVCYLCVCVCGGGGGGGGDFPLLVLPGSPSLIL